MAEKRFIDANQFREKHYVAEVNGKLNSVILYADIVNAPAADVVEVRHGEWVHEPPYTALNGKYLKASECSNCHAFFVSNGNEPYSDHPYCCECGAKMDGERKEQKVTAESAIKAFHEAAHEFNDAPPDAFIGLQIGRTMDM